MLKMVWRFASDVCWNLGLERLSLKFLLMSMEAVDVATLPPPTKQMRMVKVQDPLDGGSNCKFLEVIWSDNDLVAELGDRLRHDIVIAQHIHDVN